MNCLQDKYKIQIVGRGAYFERICKYVKEKLESTCEVKRLVLPKILSPFIDQPEDLISLEEFDHPDLLICAPNHPDLALYLAELAVETGVKLLVYGCTENLSEQKGLRKQIEEICHRKVRVFMPPTICGMKLPSRDSETNNPFFQQFGFPKFKILRKNNEIIDITFDRGAICGSTEMVVKGLIQHRIPLEKLVEKTGLFVQIGCLAGGQGTQEGAIYKGAKFHAAAMKASLEEESTQK